eukprot:1718765-Pyramimonas_sp.AAC.1
MKAITPKEVLLGLRRQVRGDTSLGVKAKVLRGRAQAFAPPRVLRASQRRPPPRRSPTARHDEGAVAAVIQ